MSLKERVYSVLLVSAADTFHSSMTAMLPSSRYDPIHTVSSIAEAKRAMAERTFDFVIINAPLPDDIGTRFAIDICNSKNTIVLLIVRAELHAEIYDKVAEYGVFTLPKPVSKTSVATALNWMASARELIRRTEKKTMTLEEKMEEIRIVNRAKWLLISELKLNEPEAHRLIEKQAMDHCVTRRKIAEAIISTYT